MNRFIAWLLRLGYIIYFNNWQRNRPYVKYMSYDKWLNRNFNEAKQRNYNKGFDWYC